MNKLRSVLLGCAVIALMFCAACTPTQPAVSSGSPSLSDTSAPSTSTEGLLLDELSVPAIHIPEQPPAAPSTDELPAPAVQPEPPAPTPVPPVAEPVPSQPPAMEEPPAEKPLPPDASLSEYDFSQPVPERDPVGMEYFSDAAFIGDSRSEGFYLYGVKRGKNISSSGLSVFTFAQKRVFTVGGKSCTGLDVLAAKNYGKVYLGFGVNELGYVNTEKFYQMYCKTIDAVRACQPHAVVYAQTIAPVNEARVAATGGKKHLNNERVRMYNELIRKAAQEKCVPLLDLYAALETDGSLPADASRDGIHINREYCQKQLDYLMCHTVDFDILYPQPKPEPEVPTNETINLPADGTADADSLLPQPDQEPLPAGGDPAGADN